MTNDAEAVAQVFLSLSASAFLLFPLRVQRRLASIICFRLMLLSPVARALGGAQDYPGG